LHNIQEVLADYKAGKMVILVDDEDRENEGDLLMAAELVKAEDINFMARFGRGLICLTLTRERCRQLRLPLMVRETDQDQSTNFTLSIEAAEGVTTGISAHDRAQTIQAAVGANARPEDIRQPGHVFPLMAQPGGVLTRAGHTEAGCDLARIAGMKESASVIVEILNEDGTMARRPDLEKFSEQHNIKIGSIADLIHYRLEIENTIERISHQKVDTEFGEFDLYCYDDYVHRDVHLALVRGDLSAREPALVRVHVQDTLSDVLGAKSKTLGWPLRSAMRQIAESGSGVVVILRPPETPRQLMDALQALVSNKKTPRKDRVEGTRVLRTYGTGAQILRDLGVSKMRVLSAPTQMHGISGFGLEVVEYVDEQKPSEA
jgi:3,4-dihydroxy 2-butanone 4-phosphate synthase/GTP cyclohydrolase II